MLHKKKYLFAIRETDLLESFPKVNALRLQQKIYLLADLRHPSMGMLQGRCRR